MIRHAFCRGGLRRGAGLAPPAIAPSVTMIDAAFFGLLMAAIGDAVLSAACELATGAPHVNTGHDGQPRPKMGKCGLTRLVLR
jgi:hypothetical protein